MSRYSCKPSSHVLTMIDLHKYNTNLVVHLQAYGARWEGQRLGGSTATAATTWCDVCGACLGGAGREGIAEGSPVSPTPCHTGASNLHHHPFDQSVHSRTHNHSLASWLSEVAVNLLRTAAENIADVSRHVNKVLTCVLTEEWRGALWGRQSNLYHASINYAEWHRVLTRLIVV